MKRETSISRRSLLVGTACAALGALTGCTARRCASSDARLKRGIG